MGIHIGTSGWSYDHWQGVLYPRGASSLRRLDAYAERFETVEVNNTFYRWPKPETFECWKEQVPARFRFAIKASRGLTQYRKLREPEAWLERMEEGLSRLGKTLAVVLFQLPPQFRLDLEQFLRAVPSGWKITCEFRNPSWHVEDVFESLERHGAAYCVMSRPSLPCVLRATARFVYIRFHGPGQQRYAGSYPPEDLAWWAERIREWEAQGRDVYAYFNNDAHGHAVRNAEELKRILGI